MDKVEKMKQIIEKARQAYPDGSPKYTTEELLRELGQKPPKDRIELIGEVDQIILDITGLFLVGKGTGIDAVKARNQILDLIPDELPKEKPPLLAETRKAIAIEYKKAIEESEARPFASENLNNEHRILWKGHANAYSEVLSYLDNLKPKPKPPFSVGCGGDS